MEVPGLPPIPTDNYYKFKALAGVWIVVGAYVINWVGIFYIQREWFDLESRTASIRADADALKSDLDRDQQRLLHLRVERKEIEQAISSAEHDLNQLRALKSSAMRDIERLDLQVRQLRGRYDALIAGENADFQVIEGHRTQSRQIIKDYAVTVVANRRAKALSYEMIGLGLFMCSQGLFGLFLARDGFKGWRRLQEIEEDALSLRNKPSAN